MKNFLLLIIILCVTSCEDEKCEIHSQSPDYFYYEGRTGATSNSTIFSFDDQLLIAGNQDDDALILKINRDGSIMWRSDFHIREKSLVQGIAESSDHDIFLSGRSASFSNEDFNSILLVKLNSLGDTLWTKTFPAATSAEGRRIVAVRDGTLLIAGDTEDPVSNSFSDLVLMKVDTEGQIIWSNTYSSVEYESVYNLLETSDGGYLITGSSTFDKKGSLLLFKVDSNGEMLWKKIIGPETKRGHQTIELQNGDLVTTGSYNSPTPNDQKLLLLKTDAQGNVIWEKHLGEGEGETGQVLKENADGGFTVGGYAISISENGTENILLRTDRDGKLEWCRYFIDSGYGRIENILGNPDDTNIITGNIQGDIFMAVVGNE